MLQFDFVGIYTLLAENSFPKTFISLIFLSNFQVRPFMILFQVKLWFSLKALLKLVCQRLPWCQNTEPGISEVKISAHQSTCHYCNVGMQEMCLHWYAINCTALHCTALCCAPLYYAALHCNKLYFTILNQTAVK